MKLLLAKTRVRQTCLPADRPIGLPRFYRRGFTILETTIGLTILAVAVTLLAQVTIWSLAERDYSRARQDALEQAANILESARTVSWDALTPEWARAQKLSSELEERLTDARLRVSVEPEPSRPLTKRVTVAIDWQIQNTHPAKPVKLVSLFSARGEENKP
jgi:prepilin-type N-terminal cleavage/methylation domain-containing protein